MTTDPRLLVAVTALHVLAAAGALYLARPRRAPYYRPMAWLLAGSLVTELVRWGNRVWVLRGLPRPLEGWHRLPGHLEQALALAWPAAVVGVVGWVFWPRAAPRAFLAFPAVAYLAVLGVLVTHYPAIRGERLDAVYRQVGEGEAAALVVLGLVAFFRAPTWPLVTDRAVMLLVGAELARFGGALGWNHSPMRDADLDALVYGALYAATAMVQGVELWRLYRGSGSPIAS